MEYNCYQRLFSARKLIYEFSIAMECDTGPLTRDLHYLTPQSSEHLVSVLLEKIGIGYCELYDKTVSSFMGKNNFDIVRHVGYIITLRIIANVNNCDDVFMSQIVLGNLDLNFDQETYTFNLMYIDGFEFPLNSHLEYAFNIVTIFSSNLHDFALVQNPMFQCPYVKLNESEISKFIERRSVGSSNNRVDGIITVVFSGNEKGYIICVNNFVVVPDAEGRTVSTTNAFLENKSLVWFVNVSLLLLCMVSLFQL